jgi:hypothetical protein
MAYVPGCSADVFISYSHEDNNDGWIASLVENVLTPKLLLSLPEAEVWFDKAKIETGDYFESKIKCALPNIPIFAAIVSPRYLASDFCMLRELQWFQDHGGTEIAQLIAVAVEDEEVPVPKADFIRLYDKETLQQLSGDALTHIIERLALVLITKLRACWEARQKIYVAQVHDDSLKDLKKRLKQEGYAIHPQAVFLGRTADSLIVKRLEASDLSIHLKDSPDDPLARRQRELAERLAKPMILRDRAPRLDELDSLVAEVQTALSARRRPAVYLIYDYHSDRDRVTSLCEPIKCCTGCDLLTPGGGETLHRKRLKESAGLLLFRSEDAPEEWLKSQQDALLQAAALRGARAPEAWYFTHRVNGQPAGVQCNQGPRAQWIIDRTGDPNIEDLRPFFAALKPRAAATGGVAIP